MLIGVRILLVSVKDGGRRKMYVERLWQHTLNGWVGERLRSNRTGQTLSLGYWLLRACFLRAYFFSVRPHRQLFTSYCIKEIPGSFLQMSPHESEFPVPQRRHAKNPKQLMPTHVISLWWTHINWRTKPPHSTTTPQNQRQAQCKLVQWLTCQLHDMEPPPQSYKRDPHSITWVYTLLRAPCHAIFPGH